MAAVACAANAFAQPAARPPSGVVFGGAGGSPADRQSLNLTVDLAEAYDQDVVAQSGASQALGVRGQRSVHGDDATTGLQHGSWPTAGGNHGRVERALLCRAAPGSLAHEPFRGSWATRPAGTTNVTVPESGRHVLTGALLGSVCLGSRSRRLEALSRRVRTTSSTRRPGTPIRHRRSLTHNLTGRAAVEFIAGLRHSEFTVTQPGYSNVHSAEVGGRFTYAVTRNVRLRFGHTFRHGQYTGLPRLDASRTSRSASTTSARCRAPGRRRWRSVWDR